MDQEEDWQGALGGFFLFCVLRQQSFSGQALALHLLVEPKLWLGPGPADTEEMCWKVRCTEKHPRASEVLLDCLEPTEILCPYHDLGDDPLKGPQSRTFHNPCSWVAEESQSCFWEMNSPGKTGELSEVAESDI